MQVTLNPTISQPKAARPTFQAVIPKYVKEAEKDVQRFGQMNSIILRKLYEDIVLFKKVAIIDGIDTFEAIRKFAPNALNVIDDYLENLKN